MMVNYSNESIVIEGQLIFQVIYTRICEVVNPNNKILSHLGRQHTIIIVLSKIK